MRVAIVGGTGIRGLGVPTQPLLIETPRGDVEVHHARLAQHDVFFLDRHGTAARPAHAIDHRANVDALARCRVDRVLALNSVGALRQDLAPGTLLVPHDLLDLRAGKASFFDDAPIHVDFTTPYCPEARRALLASGADADGGVYVATEGPRLETPAEVRMLRQLGGDVVGMTGCPEAALARERGLCYASLCLVTNPAAGLAGSVDAVAIREAARALAPRALAVTLAAVHALPPRRGCACGQALERASLRSE